MNKFNIEMQIVGLSTTSIAVIAKLTCPTKDKWPDKECRIPIFAHHLELNRCTCKFVNPSTELDRENFGNQRCRFRSISWDFESTLVPLKSRKTR